MVGVKSPVHDELHSTIELFSLTRIEKHGWNLFSVKDLIIAGDGLKSLQFEVFRGKEQSVGFGLFLNGVEFGVGVSTLPS